EAVFAHELGHQVHDDLWKGIAFSAVFTYIAFFLADLVVHAFIYASADTTLERPYGLLLFFVVLTVVQIPVGVLSAMFSRGRERAADAFAAERIGASAPLALALEQLTLQNYSF